MTARTKARTIFMQTTDEGRVRLTVPAAPYLNADMWKNRMIESNKYGEYTFAACDGFIDPNIGRSLRAALCGPQYKHARRGVRYQDCGKVILPECFNV